MYIVRIKEKKKARGHEFEGKQGVHGRNWRVERERRKWCVCILISTEETFLNYLWPFLSHTCKFAVCSFLCCYLILCCSTWSICHPAYYVIALKDAESPWVLFPITNSISRHNPFCFTTTTNFSFLHSNFFFNSAFCSRGILCLGVLGGWS